MLTFDTSEALNLTLQGIAKLTEVLLNDGLSYVMQGECQSDRIDFWIFRQYADGNNLLPPLRTAL